MEYSGSYARTRNSLRNSFVAVGLQLISLLIGFWSRRIFLNHLGTEVLGLNTTASSLLGFLNLAELGIGGAIAVTLYKPIFEKDEKTVKEIVALQGWLYRMIALIVMAASVVMMCFFPMYFSKTPLPLWYAYASFGVLLYSSLLGYFFNYKQILLDAHQMNYKIQFSTKFISLFKLVAQALAVKFLPHGYVWWLVIEVMFATLTAIILSRVVNRNFPYIKDKVNKPAELRHKYPIVTTKVKQMFVHKIGSFAINQSTALIIYPILSLTVVAKYGNYQIFTTNLTYLLGALFTGLAASVGNMVAENNKELTMKVFRELYSSRFWMVMTCCICLWYLVEPFISVWIGGEYILDRSTLALIIVLFYIQNCRGVVDVFINAHGLYQDIWAPLAEAVIYLVSAILLGRAYGLDGILAGLLLSQVLIIRIWKPLFLFRSGLKESIWCYIRITAKHLLVGGLTFALIECLRHYLTIDPSESFLSFFLYALLIFVPCAIIMFILLYGSEQGMRGIVKRLLNIIDTKKVCDGDC